MHKVGIFVTLLALALVSVMFVARDAGPTHAGSSPAVSLSVVQTGKTDACQNVAKCTLATGDTFDVILSTDKTALAGGTYGNWSAAFVVSASGVKLTPFSPSAIDVPPGACLGIGNSVNITGVSPDYSVVCKSSDGTSTSVVLATSNFTCNASGTVDVTVKIDDGTTNHTGLTDSIAINCGESAKLSLSAKSDTVILVKETVEISIDIGALQVKDANGDGTAGYIAWQAQLAVTGDLKILGDPVFKQPANAVTAIDDQGSTIVLGAAVDPITPQESDVEDNLVNITFECNGAGVHTVALVDDTTAPDNTLVVSESDVEITRTVNTAAVSVDCRAVVMSLSVKDSKVTKGNTHWVPKGGTFRVNVSVDQVINTTYDEFHAKLAYTTAIEVDPATDASYQKPPCFLSAGTTTENGGQTELTTACDTVDTDGNAADTGVIVEVTFACVAGSGIATVDIELIDLGGSSGTSLLDKTPASLTPRVGKGVTVVCFGTDTDIDLDNCDVVAETANGTLPNVYDFWDTNGDHAISVLDILDYIQEFDNAAANPPNVGGSAPTKGTNLSPLVFDTNGDKIIDATDIGNVVLRYLDIC